MNKNVNPINPSNKDSESDIDIRQIFEKYLYFWKWFLLSLILCLAAAFLYLRYAQNIYITQAKILLQDDNQPTGDLAGLAELTGNSGQVSAYVSDQMDVMKSRRILTKVVQSNKLNVVYTLKGNVKKSDILEQESPVKLVMLDATNSKLDSTSYHLKITKTGNVITVSDNTQTIENYVFGKKLITPVGAIMLVPNNKKIQDSEITIDLVPIERVVDGLLAAIQVTPNKDNQSSIVTLSLAHSNQKKAELIINSLIQQYDLDATEYKIKVSRATSDFINNRLALITRDLSSSDSRVADYKDRNDLVDMTSEVQMYMQNASENERKLIDYQTQLRLADMMRESVTDDNTLLPSNIGLNDQSIEATIKSYNDLILERADLLKSATPDNPIVRNIEKNINDIRNNLKTSLQNFRNVLSTNVNVVQSQTNKYSRKLGQLPNQERGYKDISRQQQIFESLYLFLLQKREETEIKGAATPANLKIIDSAYSSPSPIAPKSSIILFAALIIGLLVPLIIVYIVFLLDNKVQSRKDIEGQIPAPILGEIPTSEYPIIKENDRSSLAEAIRILRTNITFMLTKKKGESAVIYVTSTIAGEGKSFVATNMSKILAMSGKKVFLLGADIRSPKVLDYLGLSHLQHTNIGITQYLINPDMDISEIIIKKPAPYDFDIIYSGYIAPNPAELLLNGHFEDIINYGRDNYDFVIVDTAPVGLVTDTVLISEYADLTLYVCRANYLDKRLLNIPKELYNEGKLKNVAVILNDVDFKRGYGYGYGYGYGDNISKNKGFWSKFK